MSNQSWRFPVPSRRRPAWLVWIPVLMVAALLYWTVALGLGGLSLMAVNALSSADLDEVDVHLAETATATVAEPEPTAAEPAPGYEPIVVHLQESTEPQDIQQDVQQDVQDVEDVNDNPGSAGAATGSGAQVAPWFRF
jgi:hypothetical protein